MGPLIGMAGLDAGTAEGVLDFGTRSHSSGGVGAIEWVDV